MQRLNSDALVCVVGPFQLNGVAAEGAGLPRADITDFTVVVVVPALTRNGIGDRFAEFMRSGRSERVEVGDTAEATSATGVRHHGVEDAAVDGVVIPAENLTGRAATLRNGDSGRKENEIKGIRGCGGQRACGEFLPQERLDGGGGGRGSPVRTAYRGGAATRPRGAPPARGALFC